MPKSVKFVVSLSCDSAAFEDKEDGEATAYRRRNEVARILQAIAVQVGAHGVQKGQALDLFGTQVGGFEFAGIPEEEW